MRRCAASGVAVTRWTAKATSSTPKPAQAIYQEEERGSTSWSSLGLGTWGRLCVAILRLCQHGRDQVNSGRKSSPPPGDLRVMGSLREATSHRGVCPGGRAKARAVCPNDCHVLLSSLKTSQGPQGCFFRFFVAAVRFELGASRLVGSCSTT